MNENSRLPMAALSLSGERALSTHDQVAMALGKEILAGVHRPGAKLPRESEILERFGVSRTVLREVLKTLTAKGLVTSKTRVGTVINEPKRWSLFDPKVIFWKVSLGADRDFLKSLFEIRRLMEPKSAELAATHATTDQIAEMHAHLQVMESSRSDSHAFAAADLKFHLAVAEASRNPLLYSISAVIEAALIAIFELSSPQTSEVHQESVRRHRSIVDAIEARDPDAASNAMLLVINEGAGKF